MQEALLLLQEAERDWHIVLQILKAQEARERERPFIEDLYREIEQKYAQVEETLQKARKYWPEAELVQKAMLVRQEIKDSWNVIKNMPQSAKYGPEWAALVSKHGEQSIQILWQSAQIIERDFTEFYMQVHGIKPSMEEINLYEEESEFFKKAELLESGLLMFRKQVVLSSFVNRQVREHRHWLQSAKFSVERVERSRASAESSMKAAKNRVELAKHEKDEVERQVGEAAHVKSMRVFLV